MSDPTKRLCGCGCGRPLPPQLRKDRPRRFINGHGGAKTVPYRVDPDTGCWVWLRSWSGKYPGPYGTLKVDGKRYKAHRWYFEQAYGSIPPGKHLDHLCRNTLCVNPAHLEVVTNAENARRGARAKLTAEQVAEIRRLAATVSRAELGRRFGVSAVQISRIVLGQRW